MRTVCFFLAQRVFQRLARWLILLPLHALAIFAADRNPGDTNSPLYLLSYDHGGVILWGADHFAERLRNATNWLERHPGFKIGLENEAYLYDWLAENQPPFLDELRSDLEKYRGRLGIGTCTYGQPLSSFINEESNIRQIAFALETDQKRLGCRPAFYLMSEHAQHSQLPQLLSGLGFEGAILRTHFMMYGYNPTFDLPTGWWVGLDGSRLPAVPTYPGEGAGFGITTSDNWFLTRYPGSEVKVSPAEFRKKFAHIRPLLATRADDSGLRKEQLVQECEGKADYRWILLEDLPSILPRPQAEMKTGPNDFVVRMPWGYCGNEIWNQNRQAEVLVLSAERLAALSVLAGSSANHETELDLAWKDLLVGQHHDVQICGLLPEARKFLSGSISTSSNVLHACLESLAGRMKGDGLAQVTVFNPLSWSRGEWVEAEVSVPRGSTKALTVRHKQKAVASTLLQADRSSSGTITRARLAFRADLPPLAVVSYSIMTEQEPDQPQKPQVTIDREKLRLITPWLEAHLDPHGGLSSLTDKRTGAALLSPGKRSAFFAGQINGHPCESAGKWTLHMAGENSSWAMAREYGFIGEIPYTLEIRFPAEAPRLDCRVTFHFEGEQIGRTSEDRRDARSPFVHEEKMRFKLFPELSGAAVGVRDLPFAVSETTNRYVEGLYWTALAGDKQGLAFFNRGTMGAVRETDGGFSLPLAYGMDYIWGTRILNGDFSYEFALYPFAGPWTAADLQRQALAYNFPAVSITTAPGEGRLGETVRPLELGSEHVLLSALFTRQDRVYARLYECPGRDGETPLVRRDAQTRFWTTDLLGQDLEQAGLPLRFHPWQIRTVRCEK